MRLAERWIALDESAALDPGLVGAKAAGLARAVAAGLPVLPGAVLPVAASTRAVSAGADALRRSGPPAAYLEATAAGAHADGLRAPEAAGVGPWVVRSSTPLDDDGRWSGAFASYLDVSVDDLVTAVRGCWSSAVGRDAVARCDAIGLDVGSIRVGVVVQPFVRCRAGGTARVESDGGATVIAAAGGPAGVVSSGLGDELVVDAAGRWRGSVPRAVRREDVEGAAALARSTAASTGSSSIEWGALGDEVMLFQLGPERAAHPTGPRAAPADIPEEAERIARLVSAFPGPLGIELVLPWAFGADLVPRPVGADLAADTDKFRETRRIAAGLASEAWGVGPSEAIARTEQVSALVWSGRLDDAVHALSRLRRPDPVRSGRVLAALAAVGDRLVNDGRLPAAALVWRLTSEEVAGALGGSRAPIRRGPDRWEPFVAEVVRARGRATLGTPVSAGIGAGRSYVVDRLADTLCSTPRSVLVAARPLPQLAPLLWHSAALVTLRGSAGAHLFEVARSLGVPTVTGVQPSGLADGALLAVDGDRGFVSILTGSGTDVPAPALVGSSR